MAGGAGGEGRVAIAYWGAGGRCGGRSRGRGRLACGGGGGRGRGSGVLALGVAVGVGCNKVKGTLSAAEHRLEQSGRARK